MTGSGQSAGAEVVLVRHGETEWSLDGRHTGRTDIPLTENGRRQARAVAPRLAGRSFGSILSSPLERAVETCRLTGLGDPRISDDLIEWDYGDYDGITTPQIREQRPSWNLWSDGCPSGEHAKDVGERVDRVIDAIRNDGREAALIAHGHVLRVLAARWVGLPARDGAMLGLATATLSVLGWERETPVIRLWNDSSHLDA